MSRCLRRPSPSPCRRWPGRCSASEPARSSGRNARRGSARGKSKPKPRMLRMKPSLERATGSPARRASLAIDNLRAIVIVLVLAFHSVLAYLNFLPAHPFAFDAPPYLWRSFPIVDTARFMGFDLFCAWLDVFLMSFFFMLSGLFVWPSLERKGAWTFL